MTVIVPTDFSSVANNAVLYAGKMLAAQQDVTLIIYHVAEKQAEEAEAMEQLEKLKAEVLASSVVKIECRTDESSDFIGSLERLARHTDAGLIVMGITGKSRLEQVFLGSNTLKMVERNACPVLVIPPSAQHTQIKNVALLSDFKEVKTTVPIVPIKNVLKLFRPSLHVVNVNSEHYVSLSEEYLGQRAEMRELFGEFNPEFYFIGTYDLLETAQQFTLDKNIDVLITIPRNHSFFGSMFKTSNTRKLVYESAIPILAAHE